MQTNNHCTGCLKTYGLGESDAARMAGQQITGTANAHPQNPVTFKSNTYTVDRDSPCGTIVSGSSYPATLSFSFELTIAGTYELYIGLPGSCAHATMPPLHAPDAITVHPADLDPRVSTTGSITAGDNSNTRLFKSKEAGSAIQFGVIPRDSYRNVRENQDRCTITPSITSSLFWPTKSALPEIACIWNAKNFRFRASIPGIDSHTLTMAGDYSLEVKLGSGGEAHDIQNSPFTFHVFASALDSIDVLQTVSNATVDRTQFFRLTPLDKWGNTRCNDETCSSGNSTDVMEVTTDPSDQCKTSTSTPGNCVVVWDTNDYLYTIAITAKISAPQYIVNISLSSGLITITPIGSPFSTMMRPNKLTVSACHQEDSGPQYSSTVAGRPNTFTVVPRDAFGNVRDQVGANDIF